MKEIKNLIRKCWFISLVMYCCVLVSCDYLDVVPPETADLDDVMRDKEDALAYLYSCYSATRYSQACNNLGCVESSTDEFVNPVLWARLNQWVSWNQLSGTTVSNWDPVDLPWKTSYDAIGYCHLFLKTLEEQKPFGVTDTDITRWRAEISFLLAYYHFRVLESYGPIPMIEHYYSQNTPKSEFPGRSHFDYCVDRIVQWLDEAAEILPPTVIETELGRATSTICKALKARVLLYAASPLWNGSFPFPQWKNTNFETPGYGKELVSHTRDPKKWERAKNACEEALAFAQNAGKRSLYTLEASEELRQMQGIELPDIPDCDDDFKKKVMQMRYLLAAAETEGNNEVIWGVIPYYSPGFMDSMPHGITKLHNGNLNGGVCAQTPLLYAVEHFYTKKGKLPVNDPDFYKENEWFTSIGERDIIKLNDKREPRFYAWLSFDGDEYGSKYNDGNRFYVDLKNSQKQGYNPDKFNRDNCVTGYFLKKWAYPNVIFSADGSVVNFMVRPMPLIRLSELYLNLAECYAALDESQLAIDNLNEVRTRAGVPKLKEADLKEMSLDEWIQNERFIELFAEGHRYYDARRWMTAPELFKAGTREGLNAIEKKDPTFKEFNKRVKIDQPFQWDDRMFLLPINVDEIYSNPQLIQAPRY